MQCPKCKADNPDTSRFCGNCATSLTSAKAAPPSLTETLESPDRLIPPGTVYAGRYEILERIGAGGMGEVFRAIDKNLGRQVAIKILPSAFAEDKERMARFEREAKLLAVLNHPNIAAIYGLEVFKGRRFLVLELAEGETLQARLNLGALPVDEALEICREIAEGLESAHEKGIVHRDLKPSNIMITPEGKVKILDFGLAKAYGGETAGIDIEKSPTITALMTEPGVVLGTTAYMSPEQARGRAVDKRADIWAFGCVLYECLTARRAFHGESVTDTLAHILRGEPDWSRLPPETPITVRTLLRHCFEKSPKERSHDIADVRIDIVEALSRRSFAEPVPARKRIRAWTRVAVIGGVVLAVLSAVLITWHLRPALQFPRLVRSVLKIEAGQWLGGMLQWGRPSRTAIAISKDGTFIVYSAITENGGPQARRQIYLRRMDQMESTPVAGTEGGFGPFLSPDDRWIGFWAGGKLKKVPVAGGLPIELCQAGGSPFGADWGADNTIVFSSGQDVGLSQISGEGGRSDTLTVPNKAAEELGHRLPHFLPDGRHVLFTIAGNVYDLHPSLALLDLETRKWRAVIDDAGDGRYLRSGHLIFLRQGTLMAVAYDPDRFEVQGQPLPIVENVMQALTIANGIWNTAAGQYGVSDSGWLVYVPGGTVPLHENSVVRVDMKGNIQPLPDLKGPSGLLRLSPDGQRIAYLARDGAKELYAVYDLHRSSWRPLIAEGHFEYCAWPPDGKRLLFNWYESGQPNLYWQLVDENSPKERLTTSANYQAPGSFTPDGSTLAFVEVRPETGEDILLLDMKTLASRPFLSSKANEGFPEFSPDGRWLAYASNESGLMEVWVRPFPGPGRRLQISRDGGSEPVWSKDGRQLFYTKGDQAWAADFSSGADPSAGKPRLLFEQPDLFKAAPLRSWDLWPDGRGFFMVKVVIRPQPATEMILVQNWFEELKRLAPTGKK